MAEIAEARRGALESLRLAEVTEVWVEEDAAFAKIERFDQVAQLQKVGGAWKLSVPPVSLLERP